nr:translation initiation factor IF-2-like [Aegilops tauschii subsp. strangulata]
MQVRADRTGPAGHQQADEAGRGAAIEGTGAGDAQAGGAGKPGTLESAGPGLPGRSRTGEPGEPKKLERCAAFGAPTPELRRWRTSMRRGTWRTQVRLPSPSTRSIARHQGAYTGPASPRAGRGGGDPAGATPPRVRSAAAAGEPPSRSRHRSMRGEGERVAGGGWIQQNRPAATLPGAGAGFAGRSSGGSEVGSKVGRGRRRSI